jgi:hypothetical protein
MYILKSALCRKVDETKYIFSFGYDFLSIHVFVKVCRHINDGFYHEKIFSILKEFYNNKLYNELVTDEYKTSNVVHKIPQISEYFMLNPLNGEYSKWTFT